MPVTPRRSTRGAIFTPSPFPSPSAIAPNTTFAWTSAPLSAALPPVEGGASSSKLDVAAPGAFPNPTGDRSYYSSYTRIVSHSGLTPRKNGKKPRANKGDEESRFAIGDGVLVDVEGGADGVGVLIRLWEEPDKDEDEEGDEDSDGGNDSARRKRKDENGDATEVRMMAEVHWCFRRKDLPGIMKNLTVEDNEVLLAASPIRPVTTTLPVALLVRTVPIYSLPFFVSQFAPTKSVVKGWTYVRQGIYWCAKAFDKGAKGGKVYRVDIDQWRDNGKQGLGWNVQVQEDVPEKPVDSSDSDSASEAGSAKAPDKGESSDSGSSGGEEEEGAAKPKRARRTKAKDTAKPRKRQKLVAPSIPMGPKAKATKGKRMPHPKLPSSKLPASIMDTEQLPSDPYQRALRLLHVGATPESLPCREEEFVDVLSKVEEGVESGGGGCLYIAGVPGTGKTATVHAVVKELKRKAEDGELPPFSYVEINGLKIPSPQHAYTVLWEAISGQKGCSTKTALRGLETHFGRKTTGVRGPRANTYVVLMDELDQLLTAKQDVVYNFFNWPTMRDSQLFVVAVANRMDLPQHLAAKIKSRLGLQTLLFQPYDRQSLIEIVQSRLIPHPKSKAEHKVLQPDAIALAATKMAGTNGDARRVLDACRRAVEVALEPKEPATSAIHPVTAKEMMAVLNQMSSSPVALFLKQCSLQQKLMLAALVRCIRREGVPEIRYRSIKSDHDNLVKSLLETNDLLSNTELNIVFSSLISCNALSCGYDLSKGMDDRKVALGMEISEVGRVLMNEGEAWRRALAGT